MIRQATPKPKTALTPAVAYIRMSSRKQDASPEQQRQEAAKLATANNCRILREYSDEGISGDSPKRPGFQQMIKDAVEKRDFAAIVRVPAEDKDLASWVRPCCLQQDITHGFAAEIGQKIVAGWMALIPGGLAERRDMGDIRASSSYNST